MLLPQSSYLAPRVSLNKVLFLVGAISWPDKHNKYTLWTGRWQTLSWFLDVISRCLWNAKRKMQVIFVNKIPNNGFSWNFDAVLFCMKTQETDLGMITKPWLLFSFNLNSFYCSSTNRTIYTKKHTMSFLLNSVELKSTKYMF